jgi:pimeloyl-ACP methyl ester carboxylesterase/DNA-binding CsgD family transcriptional regulator
MEALPVQYFTTSDGYNIAHAVCGEGTPLLRVPGMFSHFSLQWERDILARDFQALSAHFRLVLADARGQGASTRGLADSTLLDDYVRDLEQLADRLGLERFILLAVSAMGKIAVRYAVKHPERIIALVLQQYTEVSQGTRLGLWELAERDWPMLIQTTARVGFAWADPSATAATLQDSMTQADFLRLGAALSAESGDEMLRALRVPTLVIATRAEARPFGRDQEARRVAALIPDARLVIFDDQSGGFGSRDGDTPPAITAIQNVMRESAMAAPPARSAASAAVLSQRELEVLRLLATGKSNQEIADELVISVNTARRHVSNVFDKIGVANRAQATAYAKDHGLA